MPTIQQENGSGARRTARWRDRRRRGYKVYQIEVSTTDIDGLVAHGVLDRLRRDDQTAVEAAVGVLLDRLGR